MPGACPMSACRLENMTIEELEQLNGNSRQFVDATIEKVGIVLWDSFDFNGIQPLGW